MADASALYPQPPKQAEGLLGGSPLAVIGAMNQLNVLRNSNAEFAARQATGSAYRNALKPDGSINQENLAAGLQNPAASYTLPETMSHVLTQRGQAISNATAQFEQAAKQNQFVMDGLGTLADKPNVSHEDVRRFVVSTARNTSIPTPILNTLLGSLPKDPAQLKQALVAMRNMAIGSGNLSTPTVSGYTPQNAEITSSRGQFNYQTAGGASGDAPAQSGSRATPAGPPGIAAPAPGLVESSRAAATATGSESGQMLAHHYAQSAEFNRQIFPLETAISSLERLGTTGTGPGTESVNHIKSFLLSMGTPGIDVDKIKNFDEAKKYLTDFVNQTGNSGTNDKLAAAFAGNPSVNISNAAAIDVTKAALALRRMQEARIRSFDASGLPEKDFAKFASRFNAKSDPRVYGFDLMTAEQRKAVIQGLPSETRRSQFMMDVEDAERSGLLRNPALMPPQTDKKK